MSEHSDEERASSGPSMGDSPSPGGALAGCLNPLGGALAALAVLLAAGVGLGIGRCSSQSAAPPAASVTVVRPTPNVVTAVRDLERLEGAQFHMERVIDLKEKQRALFGLVEAEDAILLVAAGDVTAGVDLSRVGDGDVKVDDAKTHAEIVLPPPEILSARIDNERTYVHRRDTDVLAKRKESLETRARREAERSIVEAAKEAGILERARKNTRNTVGSLVKSLGFSKVTVKFSDEAG